MTKLYNYVSEVFFFFFYVDFILLADLMCVSVNRTGLEQTVAQLFALSELPSTILPKWLQHV